MRAVVTGSTRGLGEAIARDLAGRGWFVTLNGTTAERCEGLAAELGGRAVIGSVADAAVAEALAEGGVDLLVNNAGNTRDGMLMRMSVEDFDEVVATHLRGTWLASRACARAMKASKAGGTIINVVSGTALFGNVAQSNYAAAKGGVLALTRALSLELARHDIRVNAIAPVVATDMTAPLFDLAGDRAEELRALLGTPAGVAPVISALAAAQVTGQVIGFDGRRLRMWTHPEISSSDERGSWPHDGITQVIESGAEALHPDELGVAVLDLLGYRPDMVQTNNHQSNHC